MAKFIKKSYFIILPILITAAALLLKAVRYGAVDDILMYNIANSIDFNAHSEHLMFINVWIGYVLKFLYGLTKAVNWFSLLYLLLFNLAFATMFKITEKKDGQAYIVIILSGIEFYLLTRISFTVIAFVLSCAAILWALNNVKKLDKKSVGHLIYSLVLFILAFSMRNASTMYFILIVFVPSFIFAIRNKKNRASVVALVIVMCVLSNYAVTAVNRSYAGKIPGEMYYSEFQENRSKASDNGKISYKKHKKAFKKAGITKNDISLYKKYIYGDKSVFNSKMQKTIVDTRYVDDKYNLNPMAIVKNVLKLERKVCNYIFYYSFLALLLFILYKKKRTEIFSSFFFTALAEFYLFFRRRGVIRVTDPVAAIGMIILLNIVLGEVSGAKDWKIFDKVKYKNAVKASVCLLLVVTVGLSGVCAKVHSKRFKDYSEITEYVEEDNKHIYLAEPLCADKIYDQHLTLASSDYETVPIYAIEGDWYIYSYYWYALLDELDLTEYKDKAINSILDKNVRFVTNQEKLPKNLVKFYKEHYNLEVKYKLVGEFKGGMDVYEFSVIDGD